MHPKLFVAAKAFINCSGKVLIIRESKEYTDAKNVFFDVVGGRLEPGEPFEACLKREILEETGLVLKEIGRPFFVGEWRPMIKGEQWQVVGIFIECFTDNYKIELGSSHDSYKWIDPLDFHQEKLFPTLKEAFKSYLTWRKL